MSFEKINKILNFIILIAVIIFVLNIIRIYFYNKIVSFKSDNIKMSWNIFNELGQDNNNSLKPVDYYIGMIKKEILNFKKDKNLIKKTEEIQKIDMVLNEDENKKPIIKNNMDFILEGVVFSEKGCSIAILKEIKTLQRYFIKKGKFFKGWIISDIQKTSIKLIFQKDKSIVKILKVII